MQATRQSTSLHWLYRSQWLTYVVKWAACVAGLINLMFNGHSTIVIYYLRSKFLVMIMN